MFIESEWSSSLGVVILTSRATKITPLIYNSDDEEDETMDRAFFANIMQDTRQIVEIG